ncbi:DnaB-like helicase C-terminal domain-containing protein [Facklamia sp. P13069]|uniref:DnaB-like helicase C-terminal domain-containing protein n=1 Tax=Facklamia sp. P13069 TaxID=3421954 RepID=UPI003D166363
MPLDKEVSPKEYEAIARYIAGINPQDMEALDSSTFEPARAMFYPTTPKNGEYICEWADGKPIDTQAVLSQYSTTDYAQEWNLHPKEQAKVDVTGTRPSGDITDPHKKYGYIGAFNRTYNIHDAISKFIPEAYTYNTRTERYSWTGGSSTDGARVYHDFGEASYLYSEHDTDPAHGNNNAFDLVRIHKFGELDAGITDTAIKDLPSQKAMIELCRNDAKVQAEYKIHNNDKGQLDFMDRTSPAQQAPRNQNEAIIKAIDAGEIDLEKYDINNVPTKILDALTEADRDLKITELYARTSPAHHLPSFIDGIIKDNKKGISTGFKHLDKYLDGGFYEGLYVIGAISSLGKTTLSLQIADAVAKQGKDVLIFSLEMSRHEIMAKTISRLTYKQVIAKGASIKNAKSARGITVGRFWKNYTSEEKEIIAEGIKEYENFAKHIFIHEGQGDIGAKQIRQAVAQHIKWEKEPPLVIIDFLQILAPYDERATDKINTDKTVFRLKTTPLFEINSQRVCLQSEALF